MIVLIKLILAHLIGDFLLQPAKWVDAKEKKKIKAYQLYLHTFIHLGLIMLLVWEMSFLKWALLLTFLHLVIDTAKLYMQKESTQRIYFFADQLAHVIAILFVFIWYNGFSEFEIKNIFNEKNLLLITIVFFLTRPSSFIIKMFIAKWPPDQGSNESLAAAGMYIGIIERLLVFLFIITGQWEAIGFLIAAKSVFRFSDIRDSKDRKLTEYILIGTLASFGIAIVSGLVFTTCMNFLSNRMDDWALLLVK